MGTDVVALDRAAVRESVRVVDSARAQDWERPTPCSRWTLRELVGHMAAQHYGFAAAARGDGGEETAWQPPPLGDDPAAAYRASARTVLEAFARPDVPTRSFTLPDISTTAGFLASRAIGFHFIDYVAHSWDVAASLGRPVSLSEEVLEAALPIALAVPGGEARQGPDAAFRPALRSGAGASTLSLVLTVLGRSPDWAAPAVR